MLNVLDFRSNRVSCTLCICGIATGVVVSSDCRKAYIAYVEGVVQVIYVTTNSIKASIPAGGEGARGIALSADGPTIYATEASAIAVISTTSNAIIQTIPFGNGDDCCAVQVGIQQPRPPIRLGGRLLTTDAAANTGSLSVTSVSPGTNWTAVSDSPWLTVTFGSSGTGNGTVSFSVTVNLTGAQRIGTITVGNTVYSVVQKAGQYTVSLLAGKDPPLTAAGPDLSPWVLGLTTDSSGNLYFGGVPRAVYKLSVTGNATRIAGNGLNGSIGDGGPGVNAEISQATGLAIDNSGNLYIADQYNQRIRKVANTGVISTYAGTGTQDTAEKAAQRHGGTRPTC